MLTKPPSSISSSEARTRLCFAAAFFLFSLIISVLAYVFVPLSAQNNNRYIAATFDKQAHISTAAPGTDSKELLIYGGSSVAFSLSADQVTTALARPAYNLGLQAGLGLDPLKLYTPLMDPDRHILALIVDPGMVGSQTFQSLPKCDLIFLRKDIRAIADAPACLPVVMWRQAQDIRYHILPIDPGNSVYQRRKFNAYGDMIGHLDYPARAAPNVAFGLEFSPDNIDAYTDRVKALTQGLDLIVLPPPASRGYCRHNRKALESIMFHIHDTLDTTGQPPAPLVCIDDDLHFDGLWHLSAEGRTIYTDFIARELNARWTSAPDAR